MTNSEAWYVVKQPDGHCAIVSAAQTNGETQTEQQTAQPDERWGPFATQSEAIARRVGLIRSGKCQPM